MMKEFSDSENYGRRELPFWMFWPYTVNDYLLDVEGWLFFGDAEDLTTEPDQPIHYTVNINYETPKAIRVDFYGNDPDTHTTITPFAKVIGFRNCLRCLTCIAYSDNFP